MTRDGISFANSSHEPCRGPRATRIGGIMTEPVTVQVFSDYV